MKNNKRPELHYLLLLLHCTSVTYNWGSRLFELFPDIEELFASNIDLTKLKLSADEISELKLLDWGIVEKDLRWAEQAENHIVAIKDDAYPLLLKETPNPPLVLFVMGDLQLLKATQLAMVGSRKPTPAGAEIAFDFARELARIGLVITSGLAIGIDAASHRGAMAGGGKTIAVMGTGLKHIYPSSHIALAQKIVETGGVLLSEFPLEASGKSWHFPLRNRIISGLSLGTLVVEAALRSGSLITARLAAEQGREVFAIPGSIYNAAARGCHHLIHQGAKLVERLEDILEEFPLLIEVVSEQGRGLKTTVTKNQLDCEHRKLLDCVGFEVAAVDSLAARSGFSAPKVGMMLLDLELQGLVTVMGGGYIRTSL